MILEVRAISVVVTEGTDAVTNSFPARIAVQITGHPIAPTTSVTESPLAALESARSNRDANSKSG